MTYGRDDPARDMSRTCWFLTSDNYYKWFPAIFSMVAFALTMFCNMWCEFVSVDWKHGSEEGEGELTNDGADTTTLGIWNYAGYEDFENSWTGATDTRYTCIAYDGIYGPFTLDSRWRSAMVFSVIGCVVGGVTTIWIWISPCCNVRGLRWNLLGLSCLFVSTCQGLTLLLLSSGACQPTVATTDSSGEDVRTEGCVRMWGANMSIAATVLWAVAGLVAFMVPPPTPPQPQPRTRYPQVVKPMGTEEKEEQQHAQVNLEPEKAA